MKNRGRLTCVLGLVVASCGCGPLGAGGESDDLAQETSDLTHTTGISWSSAPHNKQVPFCWCDHRDCNDDVGAPINLSSIGPQLDKIEAAVQRYWEDPVDLNITFTRPCPHTGSWARVYPVVSSGEHPGGGFGVGQRNLLPPYRVCPSEEGPDCNQSGHINVGSFIDDAELTSSALHEFGHAIGYQHETVRADAPIECRGSGQNGSGTPFERVSMFDGLSIMGGGDCKGGMRGAYTDFCTDEGEHVSAPLDKWGLSGMDLAGHQIKFGPRAQTLHSGRNFCRASGDQLYLGDFDDDGVTDMLCNRTSNGKLYVDLGGNGFGSSSDWTSSATFWCTAATDDLLIGDFNDGVGDDLLCNHRATGVMEIDTANGSGQFLGTNWSADIDYCVASGDKLYAGRFNGDTRSDLLCNHTVSGDLTIDWATSTYFGSVNRTYAARNFCRTSCEQMRVGDFDGDQRSDILCNNTCNGALRVDLNNGFDGSELTQSGRHFCSSSESLLVADMNGDLRDDIVCWNPSTGLVKIDVGDQGGFFDDPSANGELVPKVQGTLGDFCAGSGTNLLLGRFNQDEKADFLCNASDLKIATNTVALPMLYQQITLGNETVEYGVDATRNFTVNSNQYLLALMTGPSGASTQDANLYIMQGSSVVCRGERSGSSFEWCTANGTGQFTVRATNGATPADVTIQVYVMPGPQPQRQPGTHRTNFANECP